MKKSFYLLIIILSIVLIPKVFAKNDVSIESAELVKHSENTVELSKPITKGLDIAFDLSFVEPNDYAKYKVTINNSTDREYEIKKDNEFSSSKYLKYEFEFDSDGNVVKPNSKLILYITVTYNKKLNLEEYKNGVYEENNAMAISLLNDTAVNPETKDRIITIAIVFITLALVLLITSKFQNKIIINSIIVLLLLIPLVVHAIEKLEIIINTRVTIEEKRNILESRYVNGNTNTERHFWQYANYIKTVTFETSIEEPENYEYKWDVSEKQNNSILAYLLINKDDSTLYDLYIMCDGYIYANPDSSYVFKDFKKMDSLKEFTNYKTPLATNMSYMFYHVYNMKELDLTHFNTSKVTNMEAMFTQTVQTSANASEGNILQRINVSSFDTTNVTNMASMFSECTRLESLDVSNFNTSKVTNMKEMFGDCSILEELNLSNFDTSNVTNMSRMFYSDYYLEEIQLSNFNTSKVTDMSYMFHRCYELTNLDLSNFNTSKVTNMQGMFGAVPSLQNLDFSSFDTSNVTNMSFMFLGQYGNQTTTSIDIHSFDTSKVTDMTEMFAENKNLETIYVGTGWSVNNVNKSYGMFSNSENLPNFNNITDKTNANTSATGYLTLKT